VGKGSTFLVYLPRIEHPAPLEKAPPQLQKVRGGQETVMVVEDESSVRSIISLVLKGKGYQVLEAASGNEALDVFQDDSKTVDLLISDFTMPRMNGQELVQRLREQKPNLKVLYISGYTWNSFEKGPLTKSTDFLQKPFGADDISLKVRTLLDA
jgi:CheY-like chemotaxis protein